MEKGHRSARAQQHSGAFRQTLDGSIPLAAVGYSDVAVRGVRPAETVQGTRMEKRQKCSTKESVLRTVYILIYLEIVEKMDRYNVKKKEGK